MDVKYPALTVRQWLPEWDKVNFGSDLRQRPPDHFYLASMDASVLRQLAGLEPRSLEPVQPRAEDLRIQRRHDQKRSTKIADYVRFGFPWSDMTAPQRRKVDQGNVQRPGWLPGAIVVNVKVHTGRGAGDVSVRDAVRVADGSAGTATISLPETWNGSGWGPADGVQPIDVIDGQHRLWAFDPDQELGGPFELPVVAFLGLDRAWQAYLFWTINITPKRINPSLAFDLYPLLRNSEWLDASDDVSIYRQARAQELTEALWSQPESPWRQGINMLGDKGGGSVSQAAWVRALTASVLKATQAPGEPGALYRSPINASGDVLPWTRAQQAGLLVYFWSALNAAIESAKPDWAGVGQSSPQRFGGAYSLLNGDQGVNAAMRVMNDVLFDLLLVQPVSWPASTPDASATDSAAVSRELSSIAPELAEPLSSIAEGLATFDWRTSSDPTLTRELRELKQGYRGAGGYGRLVTHVLQHLAERRLGHVSDAAHRLAAAGHE